MFISPECEGPGGTRSLHLSALKHHLLLPIAGNFRHLGTGLIPGDIWFCRQWDLASAKVTNTSQFAQGFQRFITESPMSLEHPRSWANWTVIYPTLILLTRK